MGKPDGKGDGFVDGNLNPKWCIFKKLRQITSHIRLYVITFKSLPGGCDLQQGLWECSD